MASVKLPEGIQAVLDTGYFADLTVVCGGREWKVHKVIACPQSKFFMKACTGNFTEAKTNSIDLCDDNPDAVNAMIQFFYKQTYELPTPYRSSIARFHVRVHILADKYDMIGLQDLAVKKFKLEAGRFMRGMTFVKAVHMVFDEGPSKSSLRDYMSEAVASHATELLVTEGEVSKAFIAAVTDFPELSIDIARRLARQDVGWTVYACHDSDACQGPGTFTLLHESGSEPRYCPWCGILSPEVAP